jgi:hypothetical protein
MNKHTALKTLRKGTFAIARIVSKKKPLAAYKQHDITKVVLCTVRCGVEYRNLAQVKESGNEPQGLPWGEWEDYPYLITHKGNRYLRLYLGQSIKTLYFVDGVKTDNATARFMIQGETEKKLIDNTDCSPVYDRSVPSFPHKDLVVETGENGELLRMSWTQLKSKGEKPACITVKESGLVSLKQKGKELVK